MRDKARSETWAHMGEGTERSVDFIMKKYEEVIAKEPTNTDKKITASKQNKKVVLKGS